MQIEDIERVRGRQENQRRRPLTLGSRSRQGSPIPKPKLVEVRQRYTAIPVKIKRGTIAAQRQSKLDQVVGGNISDGVAEEAEAAAGGRAHQDVIVASRAVAFEWTAMLEIWLALAVI